MDPEPQALLNMIDELVILFPVYSDTYGNLKNEIPF
jgi:hypothetical protein